MTNELLEQWRKEAVHLYPDSKNSYAFAPKLSLAEYNDIQETRRNAYVKGCKATHENMQKEVDNRDKQIRMLNGIIKGYEITLDFLNK